MGNIIQALQENQFSYSKIKEITRLPKLIVLQQSQDLL